MITCRTNIMGLFKRKSVCNDDLIKEYRHGINILKEKIMVAYAKVVQMAFRSHND